MDVTSNNNLLTHGRSEGSERDDRASCIGGITGWLTTSVFGPGLQAHTKSDGTIPKEVERHMGWFYEQHILHWPAKHQPVSMNKSQLLWCVVMTTSYDILYFKNTEVLLVAFICEYSIHVNLSC